MRKEKIKEYIYDRITNIDTTCKVIPPVFSADDIHKFRVEIKKLRSFIRLLSVDKKQPALRLTRKIERLYKIAGTIREAQLEIEKLDKEKVEMPVYFQQLHTTIAINVKQWGTIYSAKVVKKLSRRLLGNNFNNLDIDALHEFIAKNIQQLSSVKATEPGNEQIHNYRKKIKDLLYISKVVKDWKKGNSMISDFPINQLDALADMIGTYNDKRIMLEHIQEFESGILMQQEHDNMYLFFKENMRKQHTEKKKVVHGIKDLLKNAEGWE
ncbi:MAG: CHAD domain-containing protein [Taibaiella sp.]|nr:CHAD domain-containing protein [Taibaiella sp.]